VKLLEADANFFREYHYLNPLLVFFVRSSGVVAEDLLVVTCFLCFRERESFSYYDVVTRILYSWRCVVVYCVSTAVLR
jgi:hypothetical protein